MFKPSYLFCMLFATLTLTSQAQSNERYPYEASDSHPFGQPNKAAPEEIKDFAPLIGDSQCTSENRAPDGTWNKPTDMTWRFRYIMNGMAVQDETLKADQAHSGSIRQFDSKSGKWFVHYYSSSNPAANPLPTWEGGKTANGNIVLYRPQKAPNGTEGNFRLTFFDISSSGFNWVGEWVSQDESVVYPTWKIACKKRKIR